MFGWNTKADAQVEGGLNLLKKRILTGEGKLSLSEIPSVIGSQVQTDDAKIRLFQHIQQCVVDHVYSQAKGQGSAGQRPENTSASEEEKLWNSILARNNKQEYELYLRKYPAGRFADIAKYRATHIDDAGFELSNNGQRICDFVRYNNSNPNVIDMGGDTKCKLSNGEWVSPPKNSFDPSKLTRDHIRVLLYVFQTTKISKTDAAKALGYSDQGGCTEGFGEQIIEARVERADERQFRQ